MSPPFEEWWKGHIVLYSFIPVRPSIRPSVSVRVRDDISNLRLNFLGFINLRLNVSYSSKIYFLFYPRKV